MSKYIFIAHPITFEFPGRNGWYVEFVTPDIDDAISTTKDTIAEGIQRLLPDAVVAANPGVVIGVLPTDMQVYIFENEQIGSWWNTDLLINGKREYSSFPEEDEHHGMFEIVAELRKETVKS
jgi:hypothetical protein